MLLFESRDSPTPLEISQAIDEKHAQLRAVPPGTTNAQVTWLLTSTSGSLSCLLGRQPLHTVAILGIAPLRHTVVNKSSICQKPPQPSFHRVAKGALSKHEAVHVTSPRDAPKAKATPYHSSSALSSLRLWPTLSCPRTFARTASSSPLCLTGSSASFGSWALKSHLLQEALSDSPPLRSPPSELVSSEYLGQLAVIVFISLSTCLALCLLLPLESQAQEGRPNDMSLCPWSPSQCLADG